MIQNIVKSIEIQFKNPLFQSIIDIDEIKSHLSELKSYSPEYIIHTEEEDYGRCSERAVVIWQNKRLQDL